MKLLLTRPRMQAISMADALRQRGHLLHIAPLLEVERWPHDRGALEQATAVILTSANAVPDLVGLDPDVPMFAVGPETAAALKEAGFCRVKTALGTAESLLDLVHASLEPSDGPLAYASGHCVSVNVASRLAERGYRCEQVEVYRTIKAGSLLESTRLRLLGGELDAALFMSARTADAFDELVADSGLTESCRTIVSISLSQEIDGRLRHLPWKEGRIAASPTRAGILAAVDAFDDSQRNAVVRAR
jgi:uroporphyrinogen-III synthase